MTLRYYLLDREIGPGWKLTGNQSLNECDIDVNCFGLTVHGASLFTYTFALARSALGRFETFSSVPKYSIRMSGFGSKVAVNGR